MAFRITPTELDGVLILENDVHGDDRGFFVETYHRQQLAAIGVADEFVQDNHSRSARGVLRGLHYQDLRAPMAKLVRCSRGEILDVAVDLRASSPTFGRWVAATLDDREHRQLLVPVGFAHGFVVLSEVADVHYRCTAYYAPGNEGAVAWNDPQIAIAWPIADPILSDRDRKAQWLSDYLERPAFGGND